MSKLHQWGTHHPRWPYALVLAAMVLAFLFSFSPIRMFTALDRLDNDGPVIVRSEIAADNFAGSAFFFAEGAFAPASNVRPTRNAHILALKRAESASPTPFIGATPLDRLQAVNCLTSAIYYEAGNEPDDGQRAVAQVVLNRVRHPLWPNNVCGVVYQGTERTDLRCQFTFSCDGSMARRPDPAKWERARRVAARALGGDVFAPVGMATFYHTLAVRPNWSGTLDAVAVVGAHIFYEMRGANKSLRAFQAIYSGREGNIGPSINAYIRPLRAPDPAIPLTMPLDIPPLAAIGPASASPSGAAPAVGQVSNPYMPGEREYYAAPAQGWTPVKPQAPAHPGDNLPESTIKSEYRNSGRPLL